MLVDLSRERERSLRRSQITFAFDLAEIAL
jgi:hypothetical protein